ncbi:hypothetical protein QJS04_geneDACA005904 [Acorus gramineus]|uniref:Uncharacterized protein n=1 Tax=Acorus gramineus TaxID=55184 RepID=A0AAV9B1K4_ACOGR|nr:hypothetical protein QJS04_geneDACA005904 [Acorus gramineus]
MMRSRIALSLLRTNLCRRDVANAHHQTKRCLFSLPKKTENLSIEEEGERKLGWLLKLLFLGTASVGAYQFIPYMGENLMQQSVSLLQVKDPLFKRMGASRLSRFMLDGIFLFSLSPKSQKKFLTYVDDRRNKILEMGGGQELLNMLQSAKDDRTRKAALKALVSLCRSDNVVAALHEADAVRIIRSTPSSLEDADIQNYKSSLLKRFQDLKGIATLLEADVE